MKSVLIKGPEAETIRKRLLSAEKEPCRDIGVLCRTNSPAKLSRKGFAGRLPNFNISNLVLFPPRHGLGPQGGNWPSQGESRGNGIRKQTHWAVTRPDDPCERDAVRVAEHVMRMPDPETGAVSVGSRDGRNLKPEDLSRNRDQGRVLQVAPSPNGEPGFPPAFHGVPSSPGRPLDTKTRVLMETRFGYDFGQVRIHTGRKESESARALGADALTIGPDLIFGEGMYQTASSYGRRLLAHELAHVIQGGLARHTSGPIAVDSAMRARQVICRSVSPDYPKIEDNLTYGLFDWAITDNEAREVLEILSGLKPIDYKDTLMRMEADGLVNRLLENISESDKASFSALIDKIHQERSTSSLVAHVESLLSYGILDWAITEEEASLVLETLKSLRPTPDRLKQVVRLIAEKQFLRIFTKLSSEDRENNKTFLEDLKALRATDMTRQEARDALDAYKKLPTLGDRRKAFETDYPTGRISQMLRALSPQDAIDKYEEELRELLTWIQEEETMKAAGRKFEGLTDLQAKYMEAKAKKLAKKTVEKKEAEKPPTEKKEETRPPTETETKEAFKDWVKAGAIEQKKESEIEWLKIKKKKPEEEMWERNAKKAIDLVVAYAKAKYPELRLTQANFRADFESVERLGKRVLAHTGMAPDGTRQCVFGYNFVNTALEDPAYVMSIVVHEIFGHPAYDWGQDYLLKLYDAAAAKVKGYVQPTGEERKAETTNFSYQGTEIYSLLRSLPYHTAIPEELKTKKGLVEVEPKVTVRYRIRLIKEYWQPQLAKALVHGLYVRFFNDPRLTPEALEAFKDGVRKEFPDDAEGILK